MRSLITQAPRLAMLSAVAFFLAAGPAVLAQAPSTPAKKAPQPVRAKKIWTNEDVENLRAPSDNYLRDKERLAEEARRQKEAEEAASKAAAAKGETPPPSSGAPGAEAEKPAAIPTSLPELEMRFAELSAKIDSLESRIAGIEELKATGREDQRAGADELKTTLEKELEKTREEFYIVRDRMTALRPKP